MTQGIKKIDWLRQLYHEATKWSNGLTGQVKWSEMKEKDPNNGSKMTVKNLEESLPSRLRTCMKSNSVPAPYLPEVNYFLETAGQKIDNDYLFNLVSQRKQILNLMDSLELFSCLTGDDKALVVGKVDAHSLYMNVTPLLTTLMERGIVEGQGDVIGHAVEKKFKQIDWLRHLYLMCKKWLSNRAGQMQWKKGGDPNNSKDGNRMKMDELKESLTILVSGLQDDVVPRAYRAEINIIRGVLCHKDGCFRNTSLAAAEHLRKIALKLEETFSSFDDPENLVSSLESEKLPWVLSTVTCLRNHLGEPEGVQEPEDEQEAAVPALEVEKASHDVMGIIPDLLAGQQLERISLELKEQQIDLMNGEEHESDGTEFLDKIMDEAIQQDLELQGVTFEMGIPKPSPESESDSDTFLLSPLSDHSPSLDDPLSDDSGFYSPESDCPLDQEDADELMKCVDFSEDIMKDLDFEDLPDVTKYIQEFGCNKKRRLSYESSEAPVMKKAKP